MKKILLLNGGKQFAHSDGRLNRTLHETAAAYLDGAGFEFKTTEIDAGYDVAAVSYTHLTLPTTPYV